MGKKEENGKKKQTFGKAVAAKIKYNKYVKKTIMDGGDPVDYNTWLAKQSFK